MPAGTTNQPFFEPGRRSETHSEKLRNSWPPRSEEQSTDVSHDEIMLFSLGHLHACDEAKKFNRILQRQEASIVEIRRRIFNPAKRKCLDRALRSPFVKSFYSKIMHRIVGVKRRLMTLGAAAFPKKSASPRSSCSLVFFRSSRPNTSSFGAGGKSRSFWNWAIFITSSRVRLRRPSSPPSLDHGQNTRIGSRIP